MKDDPIQETVNRALSSLQKFIEETSQEEINEIINSAKLKTAQVENQISVEQYFDLLNYE